MRRWPAGGRRWVTGSGVVLLLMTVAACTSASSDGAAQNPASAGSPGSRPSAVRSSAAPDCTQATKVAIVERPSRGPRDTYSFSPSTLTIQRGGFLAITNNSPAVHALVTKPDAGIVSSVLDRQERQVIQFPRAGTFTVESADATHRAVLRLTVSGESGCGAPKPTLTVTGGAMSTSGAKAARYSFAPKTLTVTATENFTVVNKSGVPQTVICTPDPGGNRDNSRLDKGETQILAIDKPGRYLCTSLQHRDAKVTVTVIDK